MNVLILGLGGALGAISRYLIGLVIMQKNPHPPIPIAMLIVNLLGSFGLGIFFATMFGIIPLGAYDEAIFLFLGIGFFGAFTTFSTFSMETIELVRKKLLKKAIIYFTLSILGSIVAFLVGFWSGNILK
ncbi:fluoride efflux transporter CrcB [Alkalihalobacterium alkalinitrilicum]|uniref:fluoride efflux transporter CrcB n=1 Tax=Alkalihalobacterium alkalinitrilicum TaxID=427920 RepID=UPI000995085A|nr:fluoride efflux transporter CrcB [Alkalihalobacterium alkalinitrilicum]